MNVLKTFTQKYNILLHKTNKQTKSTMKHYLKRIKNISITEKKLILIYCTGRHKIVK